MELIDRLFDALTVSEREHVARRIDAWREARGAPYLGTDTERLTGAEIAFLGDAPTTSYAYITCIKAARDRTGLPLRETKALVDMYRDWIDYGNEIAVGHRHRVR